MAKRFTDTDKWKKPFIRGLQGAYKLFWIYLLDDCDHAGIWQVDFEVAQIRIGEKLNKETAIKMLGDRIEIFDNGTKWFLKDFIFFQYGELQQKNRLHASVISILTKHNLGAYKDLTRSQGQGQGNGQGKGQGQGTTGDDEKLKDYDQWTNDIITGNDQLFFDMFKNEGLPPGDHNQFWVLDHRDMLNRYPKMRPPTQQAFRQSCLKHIRENFKKPINGQGKSFNDSKSRIDQIIKNRNYSGGTG